MNVLKRITSVLQSATLSAAVTGFPAFNLSRLQLSCPTEFDLPNNLRLGHLIEQVVAGLLLQSTEYNILYKNIQIKRDNTTLGELDFLLQENATNALIHLELAYKFYLYDPALNNTPLHHWIGPNRNDTLIEKLHKLKSRQFSLLHTQECQSQLAALPLSESKQELCFLVHLFVPYSLKAQDFGPFEKGICGYYLSFKDFLSTSQSSAQFYLPSKKEWGMLPNASTVWQPYAEIESFLTQAINEKQSVLVWQKNGTSYEQLFVVWW